MTDQAKTVAHRTPEPAGGETALKGRTEKAVTVMADHGRLAMWNAARGLKAVASLPRRLRTLISYNHFAAFKQQTGFVQAADHGLPGLRNWVAELRGQLLGAAEMLGDFGKLSAAQVAEIRKGRGAGASAHDAGVLAQLFRDNWATVQGLTPVTKELVEEAGEVGAKSLQVLKPGAGKGSATQLELERLRDLRNLLWTLLVAGHSDLRAAGYWQWREQFRAHVPALQARVG
jgi:hypothetical protein